MGKRLTGAGLSSEPGVGTGLVFWLTLPHFGRYLNQYISLRSIPVSNCDPHYSGDLPLRTLSYTFATNPR